MKIFMSLGNSTDIRRFESSLTITLNARPVSVLMLLISKNGEEQSNRNVKGLSTCEGDGDVVVHQNLQDFFDLRL